MPRYAQTALVLLGITLALVCCALFVYYPAFPQSITGWLALLFGGVPLLFLFEWLGEKTLGSSLFRRLPTGVRIALGVPVFAVAMGLVVWLTGSAASLINR